MDKKTDINKKDEGKRGKKVIAKVGSVLLFLIGIIIVISGSILYYLIYTNSEELKQEAASNKVTQTSTFDAENTTVAEIIGDVIDNNSNTTSKNTTVSTTDANNRKVQNEDIVVLYNGLLLDGKETKRTELKYIDSTNTEKDKYVITYYNYENFSFIDAKLGSISTQVFDGLLKIDGVGKVAISESYEAIPRNVQVVNAIPANILENNGKLNDFDSVKVIIADFDGNGTDEYLLVLANKNTGYSKISFVDSLGANFTDLAYIEKSKWGRASEQGYYLSLNNVEVIDVDNDGNMEILIEIPKYEGEPDVSILEYRNGELTGDKNIEVSLLP